MQEPYAAEITLGFCRDAYCRLRRKAEQEAWFLEVFVDSPDDYGWTQLAHGVLDSEGNFATCETRDEMASTLIDWDLRAGMIDDIINHLQEHPVPKEFRWKGEGRGS